MKNKKNIVNSNILDLISPTGIEFNKSKFLFGEHYAKVFVATRFPQTVGISWLSKLANLEGVVTSLHITPTDSASLTEMINRSIGDFEARVETARSPLEATRAEQGKEDSLKLLKMLEHDQEKVAYCCIVIMILSKTEDGLIQKEKQIMASAGALRIKLRGVLFLQEEALNTVSPYVEPNEQILNMGNRNMPMTSIAASYPFNISGLNDQNGIILGRDNQGGIILLDIWQKEGSRTNSNMTIIGGSGTGKSATVKKLLLSEFALGSKVIITDPEREYKDMCKSLDGEWINCAGGKDSRINPLQIRKVPEDEEEVSKNNRIFKDEGRGIGALALHFQVLRTFFKIYSKDINTIDMALLEEVLEELYFCKGITWDTDITQLKNTDYPIMEEFYNLLLEKTKEEGISNQKKSSLDKVASIIRKCAIGSDAHLFNGHTTLESNAEFIVLDTLDLMESASEEVLRAVYFNILSWGWQKVSENRDERIIFAVDEAWLIADERTPETLDFLKNASKRIRKYNGSLITISQSVIDFLHPSIRKSGSAIFDNATYKFFLGTDARNIKEINEYILELTEAEESLLNAKNRGEGLLIAGTKRIHAKVEISEEELRLFGKGGGK